MLKTIVKVSAVTNLSDARYCAGMGVEMLGFSMDDNSPDFVSAAQLNEIRGWLSGVQIVGETQQTNPAVLQTLVETYSPDALEVTDAGLLRFLQPLGIPLLLRLDLETLTLEQLPLISTDFDFLVLDSRLPFTLTPDHQEAIHALAAKTPTLLGAGLTADNVLDVLSDLPIRGVALRGSEEEKPGSKEYGLLMDVLEILEEA